jgi:hypothetical protein
MKRKEKATGTPKKKRPINDERMIMNRISQSMFCLLAGYRVTRKSGGRIPEDQDIRKTEAKNILNLMPGCPDNCCLIT